MKKKAISIPEKLAELSKNCDFFWGFHPTSDVIILSFPRIQIHVPSEDLRDPYLDTFGLYQKLVLEAQARINLQFSSLKTVLDKLVEE